MFRESIFICACTLLFASIIIGLCLSVFSILESNVYTMSLHFPSGVGLCIFAMLLLNSMIKYPLTVEIQEENHDKEKSILGKFVLFGNFFFLFGVTIIIFLFVVIFSKSYPDFSIYYYVGSSALIGTIWGYGMHEAFSFSDWYTYGRNFRHRFDWTDTSHGEWYDDRQTFLSNLRYWKKRFVFSFSGFILMASIVFILIIKNLI